LYGPQITTFAFGHLPAEQAEQHLVFGAGVLGVVLEALAFEVLDEIAVFPEGWADRIAECREPPIPLVKVLELGRDIVPSGSGSRS
jgi:hypothetical protein